MKAIEIVSQEIQTAKEKYGPFNSTHELYGVLKEEFEEFFEIVKERPLQFEDEKDSAKSYRMIHELSQIAAVALRGIDELQHNEIKWV